MSERVCEWCGAADEYHDYEHLSRECWPKRFEALTRQLAQAQERVARETSEIINAVRALPGELQGQGTLADAIRVLVAHNAQLRRVVEGVEWVEPPDAHPDLGRWCPMCRSWEAYGHELRCPYYGGLVNGILVDALNNLGGVQDALA